MKVCIVSLAGYDASKLSLDSIAACRAKPAKTAELRYSQFQDTLALCSGVAVRLWRLCGGATVLRCDVEMGLC